jgi:hypothetical protein
MALADDIKSAIAGLADSLPEAACSAVYSHRTASGVETRTVDIARIQAAADPLSALSPESERIDATIYLSAADWTWADRPLVGDTIQTAKRTYSVMVVGDTAGVVYKLSVREVAQ